MGIEALHVSSACFPHINLPLLPSRAEPTRETPVRTWTDDDELRLSIEMALLKIKTSHAALSEMAFTGAWSPSKSSRT